MEINFDSMPRALASLMSEVSDIKRMLSEQPINDQDGPDKIFTVQGCAEYLGIVVPTVYSLVSKRELSAMKRNGRLYFLKADLIAYLKAGKRKSNSELAAEASDYLKKKNGSRR